MYFTCPLAHDGAWGIHVRVQIPQLTFEGLPWPCLFFSFHLYYPHLCLYYINPSSVYMHLQASATYLSSVFKKLKGRWPTFEARDCAQNNSWHCQATPRLHFGRQTEMGIGLRSHFLNGPTWPHSSHLFAACRHPLLLHCIPFSVLCCSNPGQFSKAGSNCAYSAESDVQNYLPQLRSLALSFSISFCSQSGLLPVLSVFCILSGNPWYVHLKAGILLLYVE